ncbi:hypothetical protein MSAN_00225700 [Mycena sanguinolenta]|uniref:Uncharacterized protein n=1 Tax=Mycena sanguinolenta TaxID=230812 RepID=A0A8H6ZFG1_9AGAR|nr:hypothetical protein MSAN_00225700 [Mycena sanguinolenta]
MKAVHTRFDAGTPTSENEDVPMPSPPRSRSSSALGGGDVVPDQPDALLLAQPDQSQRVVKHHPILNGQPCDRNGNFLPPNTPPPPQEHLPLGDFTPFTRHADFELADLLYQCVRMSAGAIDELMQNWSSRQDASSPPFADHEDLYNCIDAIETGHVPWESFTVRYNQPIAPGDVTPWKTQEYVVHFRDPRKVLQQQLANSDFKSEMDFSPKQVFVDGRREYEDFMSGNWAWQQADIIVKDPAMHGSTFVPIILGSDKTTVSVATGQTEYYPLYLSNGLVYNRVRRAHRNAVTLIGFLAIPKTDHENQDSAEFQVTLFADGHYRRVIYGLGPYIADYPEQVLLACVVQGCTASREDLDGPGGRRTQLHTETLFDVLTHGDMWDQYGVIPDVLPFTWDFPQADIYELLSPDILHQVIKGTFKDHLVAWVGEYLENEHGKAGAKKIMADIDQHIAAVPPFPGLRRFPEGRGFKQWTGDDSKALMKGHVPTQMVRALSAFLDFCYLVRRNAVEEVTLDAIDMALARFHHECAIFVESGVCPDSFCLPRQHSLTHYRYLITQFVKKPWRRSSCFEALAQMLTINDRLDKLAAARRGLYPIPLEAEEDDDGGPSDEWRILGDVKLAKTPVRRGSSIFKTTPTMISTTSPFHKFPSTTAPMLPTVLKHSRRLSQNFMHPAINLECAGCYMSASGLSGPGAAVLCVTTVYLWRETLTCLGFVEGNPDLPGFRGLLAARVLLFMSFKYSGVTYPCALVTWFSATGDEPYPDTGMWMVEADTDRRGRWVMDIIHVDTILRGAHLIGIYAL